MNRTFILGRLAAVLSLVILVGLVWTGCSTVKERDETATGQDVGVGKYYHFDDILVPKDLNLDSDESFVYETPQFKAGSMVFKKWRLEPASLIDFFTYHMERDNWKLLNSFRGKESVLNFTKPEKTCTIKISESWYGTTRVEIQVGPIGMKKM